MLLTHWLATHCPAGPHFEPMTKVIAGLAKAAVQIASHARLNGLGGHDYGQAAGGQNSDGDAQKALDVLADQLIIEALAGGGVAAYFSEEQDAAILLDAEAGLVVACDPLDGSSNIDTNLSVGTIFSILPATGDLANAALQPGRNQLAAGFFIYGPQTILLLTVGKGLATFCLDQDGQFQQLSWQPQIPETTSEFAINAAYQRFWPAKVQDYIAQLLAGKDGPRARDFNMRWCASLVADAYRILRRGGIFLYTGDSRPGYAVGRLRLIYEANPIALLVEQAGGAASNGADRILDLQPDSLHQRCALVFGSASEMSEFTKQPEHPAR